MSVNERQFPSQGEVFLDHVGVFVDEFERAGRAFERLGFTLTPFRAQVSALRPGDPLTPLGTGNRCAMLRVGYLELLGATGDTAMAAHLRAHLARYAGLHLVAFSGCRAAEHYAALAGEGLEPLPVARLERTQATPDGESAVRASIVRLHPDAWPEGRVQIVFPEMSPDVLWHPALVDHDNCADRLSELLVVVADPVARAVAFGHFARCAVRRAGERHVVETQRGRVHFVTPADASRYLPAWTAPVIPCMAAVAIGSRDLVQTRAYFASRGVRCTEHRGTVVVAASEALGATLVFHDLRDDRVFDALAA